MKRILILLLLPGIPAQAAGPVGLLSMVTGTVQIMRAGKAVPARIADLIMEGDVVVTGRNSEASFLFCPDARAAKISGESEALFDASAIKVRKGKLADDRKVSSCRLPTSLALSSGSQQQSGIVRLRGSDMRLRFPVRTSIANRRPSFGWSPVDNAKTYDVKLMDREERVLWRKTLTTNEIQYPADGPELEWGQNYQWRVEARNGDDVLTAADSLFKVLPADQAKQVISQESSLREAMTKSPDDNGPRFLLAFLYEENGMLDEAARAYNDLSTRIGAQPWLQERLTDLMNKLSWSRIESAGRP